MWLPILLFSLAFTNAIADAGSELEVCAKKAGVESIGNMITIPQNIDEFCPRILGFFSCFEDVVLRYTGFTVKQLGNEFWQDESFKGLIVFVNIRSTLDELCDSNSQLHKDYMENEECFNEVGYQDGLWCKVKAELTYQVVKAREQEAVRENSVEDNRQCMLASYQIACKLLHVYEKCGKRAFDVYRHFLKRTEVLKYAFCSEVQLLLAKEKFLGSLELSDEKKELHDMAFDIMRRK